jgi:ABC-type protease/lipase transport system fused ATPase/permease subunit
MNTTLFSPSLDWSHEFVNSPIWVLETFVITVACLFAVLVVIGRITEWGGQFWRVAFARILLTKPKTVFLDESTWALDEGLELTLYELIRAELPNAIWSA